MTDGGTGTSDINIMKVKSGNFEKSFEKFFECYTCGKEDQKSTECFKSSNKRWYSNCKSSTHTDKICRKSKDKANKTYDFTGEHVEIDDNNFRLPCKERFLV